MKQREITTHKGCVIMYQRKSECEDMDFTALARDKFQWEDFCEHGIGPLC